MLQKSKSKQINLLKYALLLPIVVGMLIYTSCDKEKEAEALDLEQYAFTQTKANQLMGELKEEYDRFSSFLSENPEYVGWVQGNLKSGRIYTIHPSSEKVPENLTRVRTTLNGASPYITFVEYGPPPPPPPAPDGLEMQQKTASEKDYVEIQDGVEVPFAVVEKVPVFPGCEGMDFREDGRKCLSDNITKFIIQNFNKDLAENLGLTGVIRTTVLFKINTEGHIEGVQARAPHPAMEEEAIRVVNMFPKMIPGEQRGKKVTVLYVLPILFQVADEKTIVDGVHKVE